uniref:Leucine-rich repeat-containing protein 14 n=1 Tax=Equus asinus TaxID=9793 RepID=A0A8C4MLK6_EQUAS
MHQKATATLLELAARSLLSNEPAAIRALEELPRDLFVPLFIAAFLGGHKKILTAMVRVWPFRCLHVGTLSVRESYYEIVEALSTSHVFCLLLSPYRGPKLRILDLRQDLDCETTCLETGTTFPFCFKARHRVRCLGIVNSESELQSAQEPMELLQSNFLSFLRSKVEQSFGSLHLCCRDLQIDKMSAHRSILQFLDLGCVDHLDVGEADLSEVTTLLARTIHLDSLSLYNIAFKSCQRKNFRTFLNRLGRLDNLQKLILSFFHLTDQLHKLLRVLPPQLDTLCLPLCGLSDRDVTVLSQSSQATHLRLLNLSDNQIFSEDYEPFQTLLEKVSGTLQHLEMSNCLITDSALSAVLPALSQCSHLRVLSFAFNPITMPVLTSLLQHLASSMELKHVVYPVPVHCYEQWNFRGSLDPRKLAEVQAQVKAMLQAVQRDDMTWTTCAE